LLADGLEDAFLGYIQRCGQIPVAIYDQDKVIEILVDRDGMEEYEAREFLDFNLAGGWLGEGTPGLLVRCNLEDLRGLCEEQ
jgi:hypothetical protein